MESLDSDIRTVIDLHHYFGELKRQAALIANQISAVDRGYFLPHEDEQVHGLLISYWQARSALFDLVLSKRREVEGAARVDERTDVSFLLGFAAALILVDAAKFLRTVVIAKAISQDARQEAKAASRAANVIMILVVGLVIFSVAAGNRLTRYIHRRTHDLEKTITQIAFGQADMYQRLAEGSDELGCIGRSFNQVLARMCQAAEFCGSSSQRLASQSSQVCDTARRISGLIQDSQTHSINVVEESTNMVQTLTETSIAIKGVSDSLQILRTKFVVWPPTCRTRPEALTTRQIVRNMRRDWCPRIPKRSRNFRSRQTKSVTS